MKKTLLMAGVMAFIGLNAQQLSEVEKTRESLRNHLAKFDEQVAKQNKNYKKGEQVPPNEYFEQDFRLTMNPKTGEVSPLNLLNIWQATKAGKYQPKKQLQLLSAGRTFSVKDKVWTERGPYNVGGRTRAIMFDPNDPSGKKVFAGGVSGGLWVNNDITNASSEWQPIDDFWANTSVVSIAYDPNNTKVFYVGTGESCTGDNVGSGIWKTEDGGVTWKNIFTKPVSYNGNIRSGNFYVNDIKVRNNNGVSEVYVGVSGGYNNGHHGLYEAGLYKSTDGGATFTRNSSLMALPNVVGYSIQQIEIGADNSVWVSTRGSAFSNVDSGGRVFKATDGENFTNVYNASLRGSRVNFTLSKTNADKAYVLMQGEGSAEPVRILKTTDGGATWLSTKDANPTITLPKDADTGIAANDFTRGQSFYDLVIQTDPSNDDIVYAGGINIHKSTDGGQTWKTLTKWHSAIQVKAVTVHADQHAIVFNPKNENQFLIGNDGGIYFANDKNAITDKAGIDVRNNRYNITQFYDAAINPKATQQDEEIIAGAQDNGTQLLEGAPRGDNFYGSREYYGGDGGEVAYDDENEYIIYAYTNNYHYIYSYANKKRFDLIKQENRDKGHFINKIALDKNLDVFYSYREGLTLHRVSGLKTSPLKLVESQVVVATPASGENVSKIAVSPYTTTSTTLFVGSNQGRLYKVTGADGTFPDGSLINTPFTGSISDIEFGANENEILVTVPNYGKDVKKVYWTTDGGTTWISKHSNLPDMPIRCAFINPENRDEVLLGTELGVWGTANFTAANPTWVQYTQGIGNVRVTNIDYRPSTKTIVASTYGRGVFTSINEEVLSNKEVVGNRMANEVAVYPNPSRGDLHLKYKENLYKNVKVTIFDASGRLVYTKENVKSDEEFLVQLPKGIYMLKAESNGETVLTSSLRIK